jgi:hypothetical protein
MMRDLRGVEDPQPRRGVVEGDRQVGTSLAIGRSTRQIWIA